MITNFTKQSHSGGVPLIKVHNYVIEVSTIIRTREYVIRYKVREYIIVGVYLLCSKNKRVCYKIQSKLFIQIEL